MKFKSQRVPSVDQLWPTTTRHAGDIDSSPSLMSNQLASSRDHLFLTSPSGYGVLGVRYQVADGDEDLLQLGNARSVIAGDGRTTAIEGLQVVGDDHLMVVDSLGRLMVVDLTDGDSLKYELNCDDNPYAQTSWAGVAALSSDRLSSVAVAYALSRLLAVVDASCGKVVRRFRTQHSPTCVRSLAGMDIGDVLSSGSYIIGMAEQSQVTLWDVRVGGGCVVRLENMHKSNMNSLDFNGTHLLAGGYDRTLYAFDYRKLCVRHAFSSNLKYDITSIMSSPVDRDKCYVYGNTDTELFCVDICKEQATNRSSRFKPTEIAYPVDDNVQQQLGRYDIGFRADSRWLGMTRLPIQEHSDWLVGISARRSFYTLANATSMPS